MTLNELFRRADVVSVHVQQSADTTALIGGEQFAMMKSAAIFINTTRRRIVVEKELIEALQNGQIAGAVLDIFENETLPAGSPLRPSERGAHARTPTALRPTRQKPGSRWRSPMYRR